MEKMQEMFIKDLEELKNKETEMHNTLEGIKSRITEAEERITDLEDRMVEISVAGQNTEKENGGKKKKNCLRDIWNNILHTNIYIIWGLRRRKKTERT